MLAHLSYHHYSHYVTILPAILFSLFVFSFSVCILGQFLLLLFCLLVYFTETPYMLFNTSPPR